MHSNPRSEKKGENTHHILLTNHPHLGTTKHFCKAVKNTFHFQVKLHKLGPWVSQHYSAVHLQNYCILRVFYVKLYLEGNTEY